MINRVANSPNILYYKKKILAVYIIANLGLKWNNNRVAKNSEPPGMKHVKQN